MSGSVSYKQDELYFRNEIKCKTDFATEGISGISEKNILLFRLMVVLSCVFTLTLDFIAILKRIFETWFLKYLFRFFQRRQLLQDMGELYEIRILRSNIFLIG